MPGRRFARAGFTLGEVLAAVTIIAILIAVIVPSVLTRMDTAHAEALISDMRAFERAIKAYERDVGRYPKSLDYLHALPVTDGAKDLCDQTLSTKLRDKYMGPYINRVLTAPDGGTIRTEDTLSTGDRVPWALTRTTIPITDGDQQVIQITVIGPGQGIVEEIDLTVDGVLSGTAGTVRYSGLTTYDNTFLWTFPIRNGAC